jgi:hypothetical protein
MATGSVKTGMFQYVGSCGYQQSVALPDNWKEAIVYLRTNTRVFTGTITRDVFNKFGVSDFYLAMGGYRDASISYDAVAQFTPTTVYLTGVWANGVIDQNCSMLVYYR